MSTNPNPYEAPQPVDSNDVDGTTERFAQGHAIRHKAAVFQLDPNSLRLVRARLIWRPEPESAMQARVESCLATLKDLVETCPDIWPHIHNRTLAIDFALSFDVDTKIMATEMRPCSFDNGTQQS